MILVVGSTGLLGSEIVDRARQEGLDVRALARRTANSERLGTLRKRGAEVVWGDLKDPASLERACRGATAVIPTASSTILRQTGDDIESVAGGDRSRSWKPRGGLECSTSPALVSGPSMVTRRWLRPNWHSSRPCKRAG